MFTLRVTITSTTLEPQLSGFATRTISAPFPIASVRYGVASYHDANATFIADVAYLRRTCAAVIAEHVTPA